MEGTVVFETRRRKEGRREASLLFLVLWDLSSASGLGLGSILVVVAWKTIGEGKGEKTLGCGSFPLEAALTTSNNQGWSDAGAKGP